MNWNAYAPVEKDIDILIYGTLTEYRMKVIDFLRQKYKVVTLTGDARKSITDGIFGSVLDDYILRSKILLNIHSSEQNKEQECARMIKWLEAPCKIISERSTHNYLNVPEADYWELFCL